MIKYYPHTLLAILFISYQNSIPDKNLDATNSQLITIFNQYI